MVAKGGGGKLKTVCEAINFGNAKVCKRSLSLFAKIIPDFNSIVWDIIINFIIVMIFVKLVITTIITLADGVSRLRHGWETLKDHQVLLGPSSQAQSIGHHHTPAGS